MTDTRHEFTLRDASEVLVGAAALAVPLAITEEVWDLGAELPLLNVILISVVSLSLLAWFVQQSFHGGDVKGHAKDFRRRVMFAYGLTLLVSAVVLLAVGKFPLLTDPVVALKRAVIVSLPASFSGTVVDSLHT